MRESDGNDDWVEGGGGALGVVKLSGCNRDGCVDDTDLRETDAIFPRSPGERTSSLSAL